MHLRYAPIIALLILLVGGRALAEDKPAPGPVVKALNATLAGVDWSPFLPAWFADDTAAPSLGFVAHRASVELQGDHLAVTFITKLESFHGKAKVNGQDYSSDDADAQSFVLKARLPLAAIGAVRKPTEQAFVRLGAIGASVDAVRSAKAPLERVGFKAFQVVIECADGAECVQVSVKGSVLKGGVASDEGEERYATKTLELLAPDAATIRRIHALATKLVRPKSAPSGAK
ncbi:MAG: hypothetical protein MRY74_01270 [Neomegalonema sp.]|nr:hypothetical protein [Neomegalonema sp.]